MSIRKQGLKGGAPPKPVPEPEQELQRPWERFQAICLKESPGTPDPNRFKGIYLGWMDPIARLLYPGFPLTGKNRGGPARHKTYNILDHYTKNESPDEKSIVRVTRCADRGVPDEGGHNRWISYIHCSCPWWDSIKTISNLPADRPAVFEIYLLVLLRDPSIEKSPEFEQAVNERMGQLLTSYDCGMALKTDLCCIEQAVVATFPDALQGGPDTIISKLWEAIYPGRALHALLYGSPAIEEAIGSAPRQLGLPTTTRAIKAFLNRDGGPAILLLLGGPRTGKTTLALHLLKRGLMPQKTRSRELYFLIDWQEPSRNAALHVWNALAARLTVGSYLSRAPVFHGSADAAWIQFLQALTSVNRDSGTVYTTIIIDGVHELPLDEQADFFAHLTDLPRILPPAPSW